VRLDAPTANPVTATVTVSGTDSDADAETGPGWCTTVTVTIRDHILAIDNGTQSVRALVFDAAGQMLARQKIDLDPYYSDKPGWAEQDPLYYWRSVCDACQGLWSQGVERDAIGGVALTTLRATMVCVDSAGEPLRPAIVWLDQRRTEGVRPLGGIWGLTFRALGLAETVAGFQANAEAIWIARHQPEIWDRTHKFLFLSGFLTHRLTGRWVDSVASQVGYVPFDYKRHRWAGNRDWKWRGFGIDRERLPELVRPGEPLGEITAGASRSTGIPEGLPLIAAGADKACEVLGSGCLVPEIGCLSFGTTATINTVHERYVEPLRYFPPYPAAAPGQYTLEVQIFRGYWMVSWFKQEFGHRERRLAAAEGIEPEELFDDLVQAVPPGSMGLVLQPYWSPGARVPGPEAKGAVIGFGDVHTRAHLYRAILEGLAYALREGAERTQRRTGCAITEVRVAGGGSQSDAALQITADIFGLPASRPHVADASGLGAAVAAAVGLGIHRDFAAAVAEMTRIRDSFDPDPVTSRTYDRLYRDVYLKMYKRLQPLYERIRDITGYPPSPR
jgi:sugar (pentulose or hexulose) kinase